MRNIQSEGPCTRCVFVVVLVSSISAHISLSKNGMRLEIDIVKGRSRIKDKPSLVHTRSHKNLKLDGSEGAKKEF